jgi:hypothetical protein
MVVSHMKYSLLLALGISLAATYPATAQPVSPGESTNPFTRAANGDTTGIMGLIHNAQTGTLRPESQVIGGNRGQINSEVAAARQRQLEALRRQRQQAQNSPTTPVP